MRNLNLDQLRTLIEVVDLGSFTEAAKRLHLTQPAISQQIRELENRCGLQLVERIGKRAFATPAGSELILHGRRIMAEAEHALAAVRHHRVGTAGRVRIGAGPTALAFLLPPVLRKLRDAYPDIEITVTTGTTHSISEALLSNEIDMGFTALPVEASDLDAVPVRTDPMVAILPATDDTIPAKVTPADVAQRTLILEYQRVPHRQLSRAWLQAGGVGVKPALEFDNIEAIKSAVSAGLGMSIVPGPAMSQGPPVNSVVVRPLDPPLVRTLGLVQRRGRAEPPAFGIVREAILTLRSDNVDGRQLKRPKRSRSADEPHVRIQRSPRWGNLRRREVRSGIGALQRVDYGCSLDCQHGLRRLPLAIVWRMSVVPLRAPASPWPLRLARSRGGGVRALSSRVCVRGRRGRGLARFACWLRGSGRR